MAKKLVTLERADLTRKERKALKRLYAQAVEVETADAGAEGRAEQLPVSSPIPAIGGGFWSVPIRRPYHRATGFQLAAGNLFAAADMHDAAGPVIGIEKLSGRAFTFDPWELYLRRLVDSQNLIVKGALRQGKSHFIKRLVVNLAPLGRYAINVSDSKGEHGALALAIGGQVFRMGIFGSSIRLNPLETSEQRHGEGQVEHAARVKAARISVLQQIAGLLNPGERSVTARESSILDWALDEVVRESGDRPTIRAIWEKISSPALTTAQGGYFAAGDAADLRDGLRRLVHGDLGGMFDTHSSVALDPESPYTVIDTFAISQRGSGALAVTQAVTNAWVHNTISNKGSGRRYFLIREEGWRDMKTVAALEAHQEQLKLSGEYGVAMVLIVHEDGDFDSVGPEGSKERELAKGLLRGYANQVSFFQSTATLERAIHDGTYSPAEAAAIATLGRGEFLVKLRSGSYVVNGNPITTGWERAMFDTDHQMRERRAEAA